MPMSGFAVPIARAFGPIPIRSKPHVEMQDLLALLKARTIHAVLVTLLVVLQYSFQFASSLSQQPGLLIEVFFGMFVWNVSFYIVGFSIIAVVQTRFAPGRARTMTLICAALVWVLLWELWNYVAGSHFIFVDPGLVSWAGMNVNGLWVNATYFLLAAWYYESIDRAARSTAALRESELARRGAE